jgi:putative protease
MRAQNFTAADLPQLMEFLRRRGVRGYVTVNTLVFARELQEAEQYLRTIITAGVDAVIVQDVGICRLIRHLSPDFPIHASTQMTVTSAAGVTFAHDLGCQLVVLARECSLQEINKIQRQLGNRQLSLPLEVFVHGALCVAYSGQCLTSEALGGRSANRGECAQACRMPYDLISDGETVNLGDRKYLLSPQDLAGLDVLPDLAKAGVTSLKIEGRLKASEYVANVTRVYREALDRVMASLTHGEPHFAGKQNGDRPSDVEAQQERYNLEMAFSRGLYTGWFRGIDNQELVHARFGKKRGVFLGQVTRIRGEQVFLRLEAPLKPGDGVVFDNGNPQANEEGGRVYAVETRGTESAITFGRRDVSLNRVRVGDRLWKTSDPELDRQLRQTYSGDTPKFQRPISIEVYGEMGQTLVAIARDELGHVVQAESTMPLIEAQTQPLTVEKLREQLGRLGNTPFRLDTLKSELPDRLLLPLSELNRLRRDLVTQLETLRAQPKRWQLTPSASYRDLLPSSYPLYGRTAVRPYPPIHPSTHPPIHPSTHPPSPSLLVLARSLPQLQAAFSLGVQTLYCEFEDPRKYREAVSWVRSQSELMGTTPEIWVAPPRITKPGENWILQQVKSSQADGYLIRNYDHLEFFADQRCIGDFSFNVANPITARYFKEQFHLERLTASYDLNIQQLEDLLSTCPSDWFEITIHQHIPMFHMEHCVFCAFLSDGTDYTNCGRPCEQHQVKLRDRVGTEHILQADAGCRNTVFNGTAQTGAEFVQRLLAQGVHQFRLEFLQETPEQVQAIVQRYRQLLRGEITGGQLWRDLKLQSQLGVTRGPMQ